MVALRSSCAATRSPRARVHLGLGRDSSSRKYPVQPPRHLPFRTHDGAASPGASHADDAKQVVSGMHVLGIDTPTDATEKPIISDESSSPAAWLQLLKQMTQLAVVCSLLLLWPAWVQPGGLSVARVWQAYFAYLLFFGLGAVSRMVRFGGLAPRSKDKQVVSYKSSVALAVFIFFMPLFHWTAISRYLHYQWHLRPLVVYDVLAVAGFLVAVGLHFCAVQRLGQDFDRLVTPSKLVTTGPYRWMQHPIYTSYMLLFASFCFAMHTAPTAVLVLMVCMLYYKLRCSLEAKILSAAFGEEYDTYASRTKLFIPGVV